ncbi:O-antigen ligase family protein [Mucilaginibacter aquaedulcis]|uniref:O-antigen ligase family protein n=1 Tax=Mucilaginibacter aquaedulcis TaxID=1187081 RepID=UPI0025B45847|nr:O-antigen ligase family protein [Mucilaginibacter aquaedulcis]MDN3548815.1 O-antigen ligase family protein [Mucilaginibacter aquaedulcis]
MRDKLNYSDIINDLLFCFSLLILSTVVFSNSRVNDNFLNGSKITALITGTGFFCFAKSIQLLVDPSKRISYKIAFNHVDIILFFWGSFINVQSLVHVGYLSQAAMIFDLGLILYLLTKGSITTRNYHRSESLIGYGIIMISTIEALIGLFQYEGFSMPFSESFRLTGTFKNPAPFALFLAACYPVPLVLVLFAKKTGIQKLVFLINITLTLVVLLLSQNRASWVSITLVTILALCFKYKVFYKFFGDKSYSKWKIASILAGVVILMGAAICLYKFKPKSADSRLFIWEVSLAKGTEKSVLGFGYGSFRSDYNKWQSEFLVRHPDKLSDKMVGENTVGEFAGQVKMAYNEYIEIFVEEGLIGLGLFLTLIVLMLRNCLKAFSIESHIIPIGILLGWISVLIQGFFSYPLYSVPTFILFFIYLAILSKYYPALVDLPIVLPIRIAGAVLLLMFSAVVVLKARSRLACYDEYQDAYILFKKNDLRGAELKYEQISSYMMHDPAFLLDYGICLIANKKNERALRYLMLAENKDSDPRIDMLIGNIYKMEGNFDKAEEYYTKASFIIPSRIFPKYLLVMLYKEYHYCGKAKSLSKSILQHYRGVESSLSDQILNELQAIQNFDCSALNKLRPTKK